MPQPDTDIVTRLRRWTHAVDAAPASDLMDEAADEIERLRTLADKRGDIAIDRRREIERLRELMKRTAIERGR